MPTGRSDNLLFTDCSELVRRVASLCALQFHLASTCPGCLERALRRDRSAVAFDEFLGEGADFLEPVFRGTPGDGTFTFHAEPFRYHTMRLLGSQ